MMIRRLRRTLRSYGVELPFTAVICPEHRKTIRVHADGRVDVTIRRSLVFLTAPEPGDLHDLIPVDPETDAESAIHESPDARETGRRRAGGSTYVYWTPRASLVPYALYMHEHGWSSLGSHGQAALYTEFRCDVRTGIASLELSAPVRVEAAVAFKRPPWRRIATERSLVKYALTLLESGSGRGVIAGDGQTVEWTVVGPAVGDRYLCVVFTEDGVRQWQSRLEETSIARRLRRAIGYLVPT
jgi:hypothetical protein